jgi:hypothetical protein
MSERGTPICIEYRDDRPFSVTTRNKGGSWSHYDIDWCKRDENLYCHWSGGGPARPFIEVGRFVGAPWPDPADRVKIWAAPGIVLRDGAETDLTVLGYERIAEPLGDPFEDAIDEDTHYCGLCDDYLPWTTDTLCEHLHFCGNCGDWVARTREHVRPGHGELRLCRHLSARRLLLLAAAGEAIPAELLAQVAATALLELPGAAGLASRALSGEPHALRAAIELAGMLEAKEGGDRDAAPHRAKRSR